MNLRPPPQTDDIKELRKWCEDLYQFLQFPAFHVINLVPRTSVSDLTEGNVYYDSDTNKLTLRVAAAWETVTST